MIPAAIVAALSILLVQVSDAKVVSIDIAERANALSQGQLRDVTAKDDPMSNETRKQKIIDDGFLKTVGVDIMYIFKTPFQWAWEGVIKFPFKFSKTGKLWWENRKEIKITEA